jgi:hypothetical protein
MQQVMVLILSGINGLVECFRSRLELAVVGLG